MKPIEIVGIRGRKGKKENNEGGKSKLHSKHICKYNNVTPVHYYMLAKFFKN
jgi:hypothetical protein